MLTPVLISAATLAGRRWGPSVGGWLVGLPFTSGPVSLFLALERGPAFAQDAAAGSIAGVLAAIAFALAYGAVARGAGWPAALAAGSAVFGLMAAGILVLPVGSAFPVPLLPLYGAAVGTLLASLALTLPSRAVTYGIHPPRWDLPVRMVVATGVVVLITALAPLLGPQLSGFLTTYPVYAGVLTVFAHHQGGPDPARQVLRGLLYGLFAFASFFVVIAYSIERWGIAAAFVAAVAVALAVQRVSLAVMQRGRARDVPLEVMSR